MFVARVSALCQPDRVDDVIAKLSAETTEVPDRFDGCERFAVSVDVNDPNRVHIIEEWTDSAAFYNYQTSTYFADAMAVLGPCMAGPPDSSYYEATLVGP